MACVMPVDDAFDKPAPVEEPRVVHALSEEVALAPAVGGDRRPPPRSAAAELWSAWTHLVTGQFITLGNRAARGRNLKDQTSQEHVNMGLLSALMMTLTVDMFVNASAIVDDSPRQWVAENPQLATDMVRTMLVISTAGFAASLYQAIILLFVINEMNETQIRRWTARLPSIIETTPYRTMVLGTTAFIAAITAWNLFTTKWWWFLTSSVVNAALIFAALVGLLLALQAQQGIFAEADARRNPLEFTVDDVAVWAASELHCKDLQNLAPRLREHGVDGVALERVTEELLVEIDGEAMGRVGPRMRVIARLDLLFERM